MLFPAGYGVVIAMNIVGTLFALQYLGIQVMKARKKYDVPYPTMYTNDTSKEAFNCVQRGHQNALETAPHFLILSLTGGLKHPLLTVIAGLLWIAGRIQYQRGYIISPDNRMSSGGIMHVIGLFVVLCTTISWAVTALSFSFALA